MQVITVSEFGGPEALELGEAGIPQPHSGEVLVPGTPQPPAAPCSPA
jgi:NADPH:quinone reductase-like Zn-dependent oxidoreductase